MKEQNIPKNNVKKEFLDEDYLMNIMSGDIEVKTTKEVQSKEDENLIVRKQALKLKQQKPKKELSIAKYQELFLINDFPSSRGGKVVYIRPEYHEVLLRIAQLAKEEKTTLYSYLDNILKQHLNEYSQEITQYFNDKFKPIL